MSFVLIVDYGLGNVDSVRRAFEECGARAHVGRGSEDFRAASHVVVPGVGCFAEGMERLRSLNIPELLQEHVIDRNLPLLGICLGMQMLAAEGVEGGLTRGLGFLDGRVLPLCSKASNERLPHVGWNEVLHDGKSPIFSGIQSGKDFYFVHSYHMDCEDPSQIIASTPYCGSFASVVGRGNVWGTQFHPEKSQRPGMQLLRNFLALSR